MFVIMWMTMVNVLCSLVIGKQKGWDGVSEYKVSNKGCKSVFSSGCGRFFEGTASDMWNSLSTVAELPDDTNMYFGHEYTMANLKFAEHIEPDNEAIRQKKQWAQHVGCTTPSTIRNEKLTNPFMRVQEPSVQERVLGAGKTASAEEVLGIVRQMKDNFK